MIPLEGGRVDDETTKSNIFPNPPQSALLSKKCH